LTLTAAAVLGIHAAKGTVTLVFGAKDIAHNQAAALKAYVEGKE